MNLCINLFFGMGSSYFCRGSFVGCMTEDGAVDVVGVAAEVDVEGEDVLSRKSTINWWRSL